MTAVLATYRAHPGRADEVAALLAHYQRLVRMDSHVASAHYRDIAVGQIRPLLAERSVRPLEPI
jgi:hypothetical protein